ncbi:MAG: hypothetical protein N2444_02915, partial [Methylocystis sp.]|nr:hypothetical protein [Methylocystis sp.]
WRLFARRALIAAAGGLCLLPIALYLTLDAGAVKQGWLIGEKNFVLVYLVVIAIELPQIGIVAARWRMVEASDRRMLLLAIAALLAIPLYSLGPYNDLSMRGSITPLFLLAFAFARIATLTPRDNGPFATIIGVTVILSFATPMLELHQAFSPRFAISSCNMITSWHKTFRADFPTNYWARIEKAPAWLIAPGDSAPLTLEERKCWPDHPLLDEKMK